MLSYPELNFWAILIAFIVSSVLGFLWYDERTPIGALYMKEMGYDKENLQVNNLYFGLDFIKRGILMWGLAFVVGLSGADTFGEGLLIGLFVWFAFLATSHWAQVAFEQRNIKVYGIYIGYQFAVFIIASPIIALMRP